MLLNRKDVVTKRPTRIVILAASGIGDAIMSLPLIHRLQQNNAQIAVICRTCSQDVFTMANIPTIISYPVAKTNLLSLFRIWCRIKKFSPEILYATYPSNTLFQTLIAIVSRARRKIRHEHPRDKKSHIDYKFVYNKIITLDPGKNQVENNLRLSEMATVYTKSTFPSIKWPYSLETLNQSITPRNSALPVIGLHAGGNQAVKQYPARAFAEVVRILGQQGYHIIILGSDKEKQINSQIIKYARIKNIQDLTGRFTLGELGRVLSSCRCLLCNDNGIMHLADWLGIPLVVLFSQTDPVKVGPIHSRCRILNHPKDISAIKSDQVVAEIHTLLKTVHPKTGFSCKMD
jgi:ADP-heptose:LPS heptosyltransferase